MAGASRPIRRRSSGGTGWILTAASLGLVLAMDRIAAKRQVPATPLESTIVEIKPQATTEASETETVASVSASVVGAP